MTGIFGSLKGGVTKPIFNFSFDEVNDVEGVDERPGVGGGEVLEDGSEAEAEERRRFARLRTLTSSGRSELDYN